MDLPYSYNFFMKWIIVGMLIGTCMAERANLTSNGTIVEENHSLTFCCSFEGNPSLIKLVMWFQNESKIGFWTPSVDEFNRSNFIHQNSSGYFTLTKINVTRKDHNTTWYCQIWTPNRTDSNKLDIFVQVPVLEVILTFDGNTSSYISTVENFGAYFTCTTSASYPVANITWFKTTLTANPREENKLLENTTFTVLDDSGYLQRGIGSLTYFPSRSDNGLGIYCKAGNLDSEQVAGLYVQYPPTLPKFYFKQKNVSGVITIKTGNMLYVTCYSSGDPVPSVEWTHASATISNNQTLYIPSVNKTNAGTYKCKAENALKLTNSTTVNKEIQNTLKVEVLIPPATPKLYFGDNGKELSKYSLDVIQNRSFTVTCASSGNPTPDCRWSETGNDTLTVAFADKKSDHTCSASSLLTETFGENKTYSRNATLSVNVLYPPDVLPMRNQEAIEGDLFRITCKHLPGNPKMTFFKWTSDLTSVFPEQKQLVLQNVSKSHDRYYNCTVYNKMQPTGRPQENGTSTKGFYLTVLYKATVEKFVIEDREDDTPVIVKENESVIFNCHFESNPSPNITLKFEENVLTLVPLSKSLICNHTFRSCLDAGEYKCSGKNEYNKNMPSVKSLAVKVECTPMPSVKLPLLIRIASRQNVSKTLNFTAIAFPEPGPKGFIWHRLVNSSWLQLKSNGDFGIVSSGLDSNLTIRNVTISGYGEYKLVISNSIGKIEQNYTLVPEDIPNRPRYFSYFEESLTETEVTVTWEKGFNGGFPQTFILKYNKTSSQDFKSITINETDDAIMNYTISDLDSGKTYQLQLSTKNKIGENNDLHVVYIRTADSKTEPINMEPQSKVIPIALSVAGGMLLIIGIIFGIFIYKKRSEKNPEKFVYQNVPFNGKTSNSKRKSKPQPQRIEETCFHGLQEIDDVPHTKVEATEYYNSLDIIEKIEKIRVSELFSYVSDKTEESFSADYQKLPSGLQKPCTFARKPENIALNRYNGIFPYDHSRVKLHDQPDFFINACYIDGYKRRNVYIASLGPTAKATNGFETFWEMIWHEKTDRVVMLTNLREPSGMKCEQYWPDAEAEKWYGDVCVRRQRKDTAAEYTVRTFNVIKDEESRSLTHLHYTAWPDKKVPEDATSLLEFRQRIKSTPTTSKGPIVVHCSAGIGRTGTLIAIDRLIEEGQTERSVNVFECVNSMREQRVKMVQTLEQYIYIYKALINALTFDCKTISVESFQRSVAEKDRLKYNEMFQQLTQSIETDSKEELQARAINESLANKNRQGADIPGGQFRVLLYLSRENEESDYINAVYINSFKIKDYFIVAQSPLRNTVTDFVCMAYQEECSCIVTMEDLKDPEMAQYLPEENETLTFGNFTVSCSRLDTKRQYIVRAMRIKYNGRFDNGEKVIYHFQYTRWMQRNETPENEEDFVMFVNDVEEYASELGEGRLHVLVHCQKANERSGLFCAVTILMQKMKYERQVSVMNTLRRLRSRRRTAITSMEQLKFCHQAVIAYIKMFKP